MNQNDEEDDLISQIERENTRLKGRVKTLEDLNQEFYKDIGEKGRKLHQIREDIENHFCPYIKKCDGSPSQDMLDDDDAIPCNYFEPPCSTWETWNRHFGQGQGQEQEQGSQGTPGTPPQAATGTPRLAPKCFGSWDNRCFDCERDDECVEETKKNEATLEEKKQIKIDGTWYWLVPKQKNGKKTPPVKIPPQGMSESIDIIYPRGVRCPACGQDNDAPDKTRVAKITFLSREKPAVFNCRCGHDWHDPPLDAEKRCTTCNFFSGGKKQRFCKLPGAARFLDDIVVGCLKWEKKEDATPGNSFNYPCIRVPMPEQCKQCKFNHGSTFDYDECCKCRDAGRKPGDVIAELSPYKEG